MPCSLTTVHAALNSLRPRRLYKCDRKGRSEQRRKKLTVQCMCVPTWGLEVVWVLGSRREFELACFIILFCFGQTNRRCSSKHTHTDADEFPGQNQYLTERFLVLSLALCALRIINKSDFSPTEYAQY